MVVEKLLRGSHNVEYYCNTWTVFICYNTGWPDATLAQLVEHLIRNEEVAGSIPAGGSKPYVFIVSIKTYGLASDGGEPIAAGDGSLTRNARRNLFRAHDAVARRQSRLLRQIFSQAGVV